MTLPNKKGKHKQQSFSKMKDDINKIDNITYYVRDDTLPEPVLVFYSNNNWLCDCPSFTLNITDATTKDCKHIIKIRNLHNQENSHN